MRFIISEELGKLARWLRILGFDTLYSRSNNFAKLIVLALQEKRIIVTRSQSSKLLEKFSLVIKSDNVFKQLEELVKKRNLKIEENKIFSRCANCNSVLKSVKKEKIKEKVPAKVYMAKECFTKCPGCGKIYWPGSHWGKIRKVAKKLKRIIQ